MIKNFIVLVDSEGYFLLVDGLAGLDPIGEDFAARCEDMGLGKIIRTSKSDYRKPVFG